MAREKPRVPPLRYATVGMTILSRVHYCFVASIPVSKELSSRPELRRSAVEGSAVRPAALSNPSSEAFPEEPFPRNQALTPT
jgi:hypothetical protein